MRGSKPGERRGGRKKGTPNKVTVALKTMILAALDTAGGERYLVKQSTENPAAFLTLVGKVLPTTLTDGEGGPLFPANGVAFVIQQQAGADNQT